MQQQFVLEDRFELGTDDVAGSGVLLLGAAAADRESKGKDGGSDQRSQRSKRWLCSRQAVEHTCLDLARMLVPVRTGPAAGPGNEPRPRVERLPPEVVFLAVLIVVGAVLRFATLASQSYWVDEATTVHDIHGSLGELLHQVRVNETTPPLYFVVAWLWAKVFGTGEVGLRSLSAIVGTAVIPITYLCGRELVSKRAGLVAAAFAAVSPFMIWYSQEARAYALLAALSGASLLFCARAWRTSARRDIVWWAVFSALAVLTHFFAGFLVAPEALLLLYRLRSRATLIAVGAVAVVQAAVLPLAVSDTTHPLGWIQTFPLSMRLQQIPGRSWPADAVRELAGDAWPARRRRSSRRCVLR